MRLLQRLLQRFNAKNLVTCEQILYSFLFCVMFRTFKKFQFLEQSELLLVVTLHVSMKTASNSSGVFKTESNIYDAAFYAYSRQLFSQKSSIVNVCLGSK